MIKAVFFDIDGTLVSFKTHAIPKSTLKAIDELKKKGIKIFTASGRAYSQLNNLTNIKFDGYVLLNGCYCATADNKEIYKCSIAPEDIEALIRYQQEVATFPCSFVANDEVFINYYTDKVREIDKMANLAPSPELGIEYARGKEIYQIMAFFDEGQEETVMKEVLPNCDSTQWHPAFVDIGVKNVNKQTGIDRILAYYNIDLSETIAFGDGGNDKEMLQHTPVSVAMGNAKDDVKQCATYVTDSVDDDGVWNALKKLEII